MGHVVKWLCATALLAMVYPASAGISICRGHLQGSRVDEPPITVWGQETMIAFGSGFRDYQGAKPGVEGPWMAPIITGAILVLITAYMVYTAPPKPPVLYWAIALYPFATGLVEFARVNFDASRYGFLTATWHNLPEYIIIFHLFMTRRKAEQAVPWILLWVWFLDVFIMFVPAMGSLRGPAYGGLLEQLTGICCDHLLLYVFAYLWYTEQTPELKHAYFVGGIAAFMHMLEIVPLVILLSGLVDRPFIPICVLVAFTTPVTFYLYDKFAKQWCGPALAAINAKQGIARRPANRLLAVGILLGLGTILGPQILIPYCKPEAVTPSPIQAAAAHIGLPVTAAPNATKLATSGASPAPTATSTPSARHSGTTSGSLQCLSKQQLTGTTTVVAKPGRGQDLLNMVATMPGPIRQEDGCMYYEEAYGLDGNKNTIVKFFESWSSIRSLYKHIYTSEAVSRVFRSEAFKEVTASQVLEGPFQALAPCDVVEAEAEPTTLVFEVAFDAPLECVWSKIGNWCGDVSWLPGAKSVNCINQNLRTVQFGSQSIMEIKQAPPLPPVEQPANGHRLVYYVLDGGFVSILNLEAYKGDMLLTPHPQNASRTLYTYKATVTAKNAAQGSAIFDTLNKQYTDSLLPGLAKWAASACGGGAPQSPSPATHEATCAPVIDGKEYFMMFELDNATKAALADTESADEVLRLLLSQKNGTQTCTDAQVVYVAKVGPRILYQKHNTVPGPDVSDKSRHWDVAVVLRLGPHLSPDDVGAAVAVRSYTLQVITKPLPTPAQMAACQDNSELEAAIASVRPDIDTRVSRFKECARQFQIYNATHKLPDSSDPCGLAGGDPPEIPRSGVNLLKLKDGMLGMPCYDKYVYQAWQLISKYGHNGKGGIAYYGQVVHDSNAPAEEQWDAVVIPIYASEQDFFNVATDNKYYTDLLLRDATLVDDISIDVRMLPGSIMQLP